MDKMKKVPEPGVYKGISLDEYLAWDAFSSHMVGPALRSAKHLKHAMDEEHKPSDPMIIGSLVDAIILEPRAMDRFGVLPATAPDAKGIMKPFSTRLNSAKKMIEDMEAEGITPVTLEQMDVARLIGQAIRENEAAARIVAESQKQVSIVWHDEDTGIPCKGRLDMVDKESVSDLKTTKNASKSSFSKDIANYGYHIQAAMYVDGWEALNKQRQAFCFITAENCRPFGCAVYGLGTESLETGHHLYKVALRRFADYMDTDPQLQNGYSNLVEPIDVPFWEIKRVLEEGE